MVGDPDTGLMLLDQDGFDAAGPQSQPMTRRRPAARTRRPQALHESPRGPRLKPWMGEMSTFQWSVVWTSRDCGAGGGEADRGAV